ncbi:MAG TPA: Uma2 family endonuclease [Pirellulales bacterium]|nr:Uma2 family endonuclease [Pirellulales bacterium]
MSTSVHFTLEQYERMIEAGVFDTTKPEHIELIHGELREMTPIGTAHQHALNVLDNAWTRKISMPKGVWVQAQSPITIPDQRSMPEPDMVWIADRDYSHKRPDAADVFLLIEVAESSLNYDRGEKADLYAAAGIQDYWIVNLVDRCVEVRREPRDGRYQSVESFGPGSEVRPLAFPELALPVALLFERE